MQTFVAPNKNPKTDHHSSPRWLLYRTIEGDVYFYDTRSNRTQWERPHGYKNTIAVNDRQAWLCYEVNDKKFHVNVISNEKTFYMNEEGKEMLPVNKPSSWIAVKNKLGEVYFFNHQTKETSWRRPE